VYVLLPFRRRELNLSKKFKNVVNEKDKPLDDRLALAYLALIARL